MRVKESPEQLVHLRESYQRGQLDDVLAALDVLGSTQWKINPSVRPQKGAGGRERTEKGAGGGSVQRKERGGGSVAALITNAPWPFRPFFLSFPIVSSDQVLDVAVHIWNQGGDFAEIPNRKDFELPTPPVRPESALGQSGDELSKAAPAEAAADSTPATPATAPSRNTYPAEMRAYMQERRRVEKLNRELHALRCDANYKLEIAKAVRRSLFRFFFRRALPH